MKYNVGFIGALDVGSYLLRDMINENIKIDYIITVDKQLAEANNISGFYDFKYMANKYSIPIYYVDRYDLTSKKDLEFFRKNKFDLLLPGGWNRLIPNDILSTLTIGSIGVHGSSDFLPKGRGRSPLNWSLIEDKKRFILHIFIMKPGADDGDIVDYEQFDINEFDNIKTLYYKNSIVTRNMLIKFIRNLDINNLVLKKQKGTPTYYSKRTPEDGSLLWEYFDINKIYNFIRALTKLYPGAYSFLGNKKIIIWEAQIFDRSIKYYEAKYGEIVEVFNNGDFVLNCLGGLLLVTNFDFQGVLKKGYILGDEKDIN